MADEEGSRKEEGNAGAPAWVMTFADLMSLLMCFFVLLLSFSEMDVQKYKQLAGSVRQAFGVQREVPAHEIPRGTSIVARHFRPGRPEPTLKKTVRQKSADTEGKELKDARGRYDKKPGENKQTEQDARKIASILSKEIKGGKVEVETEDKKIVIRVLEKGSFPSGLADMDKDFLPVMVKIKKAIMNVNGMVRVSGHTDDLPIYTDKYRSNWELSAARAVSVVHNLTKDGEIKRDRFEIIGYADTRPRVPNTSAENRAKNRRVEIVIQQGNDKVDENVTLDSLVNKPESTSPEPTKKATKPAPPVGENARQETPPN